MNGYITREAALDAAMEAMDRYDGGMNLSRYAALREAIAGVLTADVQEVVHAKWVDHDGHPLAVRMGVTSGKCEKCEKYSGMFTPINPYKFCPYCGAKMDKED